MASEPGDGDGVQRPVEVAVAATVETMKAALSAAGLEGRCARERGERGRVADSSAVGPADEELGSDYGSDTGLGEQCWSRGVCLHQRDQFGIQFAELSRQEPDAGGDSAQRGDRDA